MRAKGTKGVENDSITVSYYDNDCQQAMVPVQYNDFERRITSHKQRQRVQIYSNQLLVQKPASNTNPQS